MKIKFWFSAALILLAVNLSAICLLAQDQPPLDDSLDYLYDRYIASGFEYLKNKEYSEAKFEFEKARNFNPRLPESYLDLAIINIYRYDYQAAAELLKQALKMAPENYPKEYIILYNLGLCSYQEKDYLQAAQYFSQCLKLNPGLSEALEGLKLSQQNIPGESSLSPGYDLKKEYNPTTENFYSQKKITSGSTTPGDETTVSADKLLVLASQHFENNQIGEAVSLINKSLSLNPQNPEAHYRLGVIYTYLDKFPEAVVCFQKAIEYAPSLVKAYLNLGGVYGKLKDYPQAFAVLNQALKLDKNNAKIYYNLGMVSVGLGKKSEAKKYFEKARALCRKNGDTSLLQKIPKL